MKLLKRSDIVILVLALLILLVSGSLLCFPGALSSEGRQAKIARITDMREPVQFKAGESYEWLQASSPRGLAEGDALFSGDSPLTRVQLESGAVIELGPQTLVQFRSIQDLQIPVIASGTVRVKVHGKVSLSIQGEIYDIEGENSEIQLVVAPGTAPQFQLLSGKAQLAGRHGEPAQILTRENKGLSVARSRYRVAEPPTPVPQAFFAPPAQPASEPAMLQEPARVQQAVATLPVPQKPQPVHTRDVPAAKPQAKRPVLARTAASKPIAKPASPVARAPANASVPPSPVAASSAKTPEAPAYLNADYAKSSLAVEMAGFTMYSKEQIQSGQPAPVALMLSLRSLRWWDRHGWENSFKAQAAAANESASQNSPQQLETRYLYRFNMNWNFLSPLQESKLSLIAGAEIYRNPKGALLSPGYDLLKTGFRLDFPMAWRWDTGGEVLYGINGQKDRKFEISGRLGYYYSKNLSFGAGYRVHIFDSGSPASFPRGASPRSDYSEGYGETYSFLRYLY